MRIAVSGPAAAGKGTVARLFAQTHRMTYVDIGLIFRCAAYCITHQIVESVEEFVCGFREGCWSYRWDGEKPVILVKNAVLDSELADPQVAQATSRMAADPRIFSGLVTAASRIIGQAENVIADGRSAGSSILQDADLKFYLTADVFVRAERRFLDLKSQGFHVSLKEVLCDLQERDERDRTRPVDPLRMPHDVHVIQTDRLLPAEAVSRMWQILQWRRRRQ